MVPNSSPCFLCSLQQAHLRHPWFVFFWHNSLWKPFPMCLNKCGPDVLLLPVKQSASSLTKISSSQKLHLLSWWLPLLHWNICLPSLPQIPAALSSLIIRPLSREQVTSELLRKCLKGHKDFSKIVWFMHFIQWQMNWIIIKHSSSHKVGYGAALGNISHTHSHAKTQCWRQTLSISRPAHSERKSFP